MCICMYIYIQTSSKKSCFLAASLLCFRDFPHSTQKQLLLLLFAARRTRSWVAKNGRPKRDCHSKQTPE